MPWSVSVVVGDGNDLSPGANAEVGDGRTSRSLLPDWLLLKLFVFQAKVEVAVRGGSNESVFD